MIDRERLSERDAGSLLALVFDLDADLDPRFRAVMALGFPLRLGQVASRLYRKTLNLEDPGGFGVGHAHVPAAGTKPAARFDLHPDERRILDQLLAGPLRELEEAFVKGRLVNYPLFPAGRFRGGVLPWTPASGMPKPISDRRLLEWYTQAEEWVGIPHRRGRSWYGLRRTCVDVSARCCTDADVRSMLGGWQLDGVRGAVYRDPESPDLRARVAEVRLELRQQLLARTPTPPVHRGRVKPAIKGRDSEWALEQRRQAAPARRRSQTHRRTGD